jgi:hypothetical protein
MMSDAIGITASGREKRFRVIGGRLDCSDNQLTSLTVPEGCEWLDCYHNQLTSLTVQEGCKWLDCYHNQLTSLTVQEGCKWLDCSDNQLTSLTVQEGCERLYCYDNQLRELTVQEGCERLYCYDNQLRELTVPEGCKWLNCYHNQLTSLTVQEGCERLYCYGNQLPDNRITWRGRSIRTLYADGYTMLVESKRSRGDITIYRARYFGDKPLKDLRPAYVAEHDGTYAHGETIRKAIGDLQYKLAGQKKVKETAAKVRESGYVTRAQYWQLTGACREGIDHFCAEHAIKGNRLSVKRVLALTAGAYGGERFAELVG